MSRMRSSRDRERADPPNDAIAPPLAAAMTMIPVAAIASGASQSEPTDDDAAQSQHSGGCSPESPLG